MKGLVAADRTVLEMAGADVEAVLQGVVTNDVTGLGPGRAVYAALLTPQGKYLFDFFVLRHDGRWLIDVVAERAAALAARLKMYCLRRAAAVTGASPLEVALVWDGAPGALPDAIVVPDPRAETLGWRLYAPDAGAALAAAGAEMATPDVYAALRVAQCVPESGVELVPDETYILEAGFERLNGVDFHKGCYVGQEVTARMKHKTELKKRLVQVSVEGMAPPGTPLMAAGKPAGTLFTQADGRGLAHLRLDRAGGEMQGGAARVFYRG